MGVPSSPGVPAALADHTLTLTYNDPQSVRDAFARYGQAIVSGPVAFLQDYIDAGSLVPILTEYERPGTGMYAVYPPGRLVSRRVRALSDALYEHYRGSAS